jgi:hypothetical protein
MENSNTYLCAPPRMISKAARRAISWGLALAIAGFFLYSAASISFATTNVHAAAMTLAFVGFMPEALGFVVRRSALDRTSPKGKSLGDTLLNLHAAFALLCQLFAVVGLTSMMAKKVTMKADHFATAHGQLGILTLTLLFCQLVLGLAMKSAAAKLLISRGSLRKAHVTLSSLVGLLAVLAYFSGFWFYGGGFADALRYPAGAAVGIALFLCYNNAKSENI